MLLANFTGLGEEIEIENELWMYDYGQKLQINGLPLPEVFEVHFSWKDLEKAKVQIGTTVEGVSTVAIPDAALTQKSAVKAYIYLSTPEEGETTNLIIMYISRRIQPEGFETPEDTDLFHYTLAAVAEYQRQAETARDEAETSKKESESWALDMWIFLHRTTIMQSITLSTPERYWKRYLAGLIWRRKILTPTLSRKKKICGGILEMYILPLSR